MNKMKTIVLFFHHPGLIYYQHSLPLLIYDKGGARRSHYPGFVAAHSM